MTFPLRQLRFHVLLGVLAGGGLTACGSRTDVDLFGASSDGGRATDALPLIDAPAAFDAAKSCNDGGPLELSYMLDAAGVLYRYDPLTAHATPLGTPNCGNANVQWTVTASREKAYIVYTDWSLYAVDLATLACAPTSFQSGQLGLEAEFGVAVLESGGVERLFVYGQPSEGGPILAEADLDAFVLTKVGDVVPVPPDSTFPVNLTADPMTGDLYAFSPDGYLQQIDSATGRVMQAVQTGVTAESTWAGLAYGADVFLFVDSNAVGYSLSGGRPISSHDIGISPIGAGSVLACASP